LARDDAVDTRLQSRRAPRRAVRHVLTRMIGSTAVGLKVPKETTMLESLPKNSTGDSRAVLLPIAILIVMVVFAVLIGSPAA
jgi:hypothetical protein